MYMYEPINIGDTGVYVGVQGSCASWDGPVVHACKHPCYGLAVGQVPKTHEHYLYCERGEQLYLNMVDAPDPRFFQVPTVQHALDFMHRHWQQSGKILVHCNWGASRSASLALLLLSKRMQTLPPAYAEAKEALLQMYPHYLPTWGIDKFLERNWGSFT